MSLNESTYLIDVSITVELQASTYRQARSEAVEIVEKNIDLQDDMKLVKRSDL